MILLNTKLTLGSRKYFLPESPSLQMIACYIRRFRSYSTMFSRVFVPSHLRFPSTVNPYENCIHLPFIQSFPVDLVITRCPEILSVVPRILWAYCLAVLYHMNTPTDNSSHLSSIHSSTVDSYISQKSSKCHSIFRKSSGAFLLLKFLLTCIMINLKSRNLIGISCHYHFQSVDSICCECSQSSIRS